MKRRAQTRARLLQERLRAARLERPDPVEKARRLLTLVGLRQDDGGVRRSVWVAIVVAVVTWVLSRVLA